MKNICLVRENEKKACALDASITIFVFLIPLIQRALRYNFWLTMDLYEPNLYEKGNIL